MKMIGENRVLSLIVLARLLCWSALAQSIATGALRGTIYDSSGAVVPDATVRVRQTGTSFERTVSSNGTGGFVVPFLPPGNYELQVRKAGFEEVVFPNIAVEVGDELALKLDIKVATTQQTATVVGDAARVQESATVGTLNRNEDVRATTCSQGTRARESITSSVSPSLRNSSSFSPPEFAKGSTAMDGLSARVVVVRDSEYHKKVATEPANAKTAIPIAATFPREGT